jgi:hypothetical protein
MEKARVSVSTSEYCQERHTGLDAETAWVAERIDCSAVSQLTLKPLEQLENVLILGAQG